MNSPGPIDNTKPALLPERLLFGACVALLMLTSFLARSLYDSELLLAIYSGRFVGFWSLVTAIGSKWTLVTVVVMFSGILAVRKRQELALWLAAGWVMTVSLVQLLKWLIGRARPPVTFFTAAEGGSFPSGHAAESLFVFFFLWFALAGSPWLRQRGVAGATVREVCVTLLAALPALIGYSRLYLGVHWPSDVLGGWAIGSFALAIALLNTERPARDRSQEPEVKSEQGTTVSSQVR